MSGPRLIWLVNKGSWLVVTRQVRPPNAASRSRSDFPLGSPYWHYLDLYDCAIEPDTGCGQPGPCIRLRKTDELETCVLVSARVVLVAGPLCSSCAQSRCPPRPSLHLELRRIVEHRSIAVHRIVLGPWALFGVI